jgi:hypothetical protein
VTVPELRYPPLFSVCTTDPDEEAVIVSVVVVVTVVVPALVAYRPNPAAATMIRTSVAIAKTALETANLLCVVFIVEL